MKRYPAVIEFDGMKFERATMIPSPLHLEDGRILDVVIYYHLEKGHEIFCDIDTGNWGAKYYGEVNLVTNFPTPETAFAACSEGML